MNNEPLLYITVLWRPSIRVAAIDSDVLSSSHGSAKREIFLGKHFWHFTRNWTVLTSESCLFIAISWSAVPEQPLDVTANGFPQGTTKKGIRCLQARYSILGQKGDSGCAGTFYHYVIPEHLHHPRKKPCTCEQSVPCLTSAPDVHEFTFCHCIYPF